MRHVQVNIDLTPVTNYDNSTQRHMVYYEEFPEAIATGINEDDAEKNLAFLIEDMWSKRPDSLKEFLLKNYKNTINKNVPRKCLQ